MMKMYDVQECVYGWEQWLGIIFSFRKDQTLVNESHSFIIV